ncbi:glutaredoxin family protein [Mailhella sp.]|uniref:glutaredoxin family protein n=1 Tax=Mailhella sp. TaxID=1981029 RepID=UPI003AB2A886
MEAVSGSGALPFFVVVVLAGLCFLIIVLRKGKRESVKKTQSSALTGIPQGMEEDYRCGVDPCGCGVPVMYTLHTCRHCVRLKDFLDQHGIEHRLIYVDDFKDSARRQIMTTLRSFNERGSFPTLVVPDGRSVVGFREEAVKDLLGLR